MEITGVNVTTRIVRGMLGGALGASAMTIVRLTARRLGLVEAAHAVDDEDMAAAQTLQHPHLDTDQIRVKDAEQLIRRPRRIGDRPQDIE